MLALPFPYIANEAGWTVAEVGRQPWIVYGCMRVAARRRTNVTAGMTYFTLLGLHGAVPRCSGCSTCCSSCGSCTRGPPPASARQARRRQPTDDPHALVPRCWRLMLAGYAILDGFDLGVGMIHLLVGRNRDERARLIDAIGPVWNGNEVWLLGRRRRDGRGVSDAVRRQLQRLLSGADARALAAHPARARASSSATSSITRCGKTPGTSSSRVASCCSRCSSASRSATCCAACRSTPTGTSRGRSR